MQTNELLACYHISAWAQKTGARPLLYLPLAYAMAGRWALWPIVLHVLAALGIFMFASAFDDYWDYRVRREQNWLALAIAQGRLSLIRALIFACVPILLVLPLLILAPALGLPMGAFSGLVLAALLLLIGYTVPPLRLKEHGPLGFFVGPVLAAMLFLGAWIVLRPLDRFVWPLAVLLFLFQCYAEAMHVIDNSLLGRPMRTLAFQTAVALWRRLPLFSFFGSVCFVLVSPAFLITSVCSLIRLHAVSKLAPEDINRVRRSLWSPAWALYEFVLYAGIGASGLL